MLERTLTRSFQSRIHGAFAPVPTPVDRVGAFDPDALVRHLGWLAAESLDGALILGTNGEFPSFTLEERLRIAEAAATADSGLRLLLGVGSCAVHEAETMAGIAVDLGYEAVLCPPPFYYRAAPVSGVAAFFRRLLDRAKLPVLLYHIPQVTGIAISEDLLDLLADHSMLAGVKDSSGSPEELGRLTARFRQGSYLVGNDRLISRCLQDGGTGSITAAASVCPALVMAVAADPSRQPELDAVRGLLEEFGLGPAVKALLRSFGLGEYRTRPPLVGLGRDSSENLQRRFEGLKTEPR